MKEVKPYRCIMWHISDATPKLGLWCHTVFRKKSSGTNKELKLLNIRILHLKSLCTTQQHLHYFRMNADRPVFLLPRFKYTFLMPIQLVIYNLIWRGSLVCFVQQIKSYPIFPISQVRLYLSKNEHIWCYYMNITWYQRIVIGEWISKLTCSIQLWAVCQLIDSLRYAAKVGTYSVCFGAYIKHGL